MLNNGASVLFRAKNPKSIASISFGILKHRVLLRLLKDSVAQSKGSYNCSVSNNYRSKLSYSSFYSEMTQRKSIFSKKAAISYIMEVKRQDFGTYCKERLHELNIHCYGSELARPVYTDALLTCKKVWSETTT